MAHSLQLKYFDARKITSYKFLAGLLYDECAIDNFHDRLNFDLDNMSKIIHHSSKQHLKVSKIAKFGGGILKI